jgi:hypothetical protein
MAAGGQMAEHLFDTRLLMLAGKFLSAAKFVRLARTASRFC